MSSPAQPEITHPAWCDPRHCVSLGATVRHIGTPSTFRTSSGEVELSLARHRHVPGPATNSNYLLIVRDLGVHDERWIELTDEDFIRLVRAHMAVDPRWETPATATSE
jgi:hypothetical protein